MNKLLFSAAAFAGTILVLTAHAHAQAWTPDLTVVNAFTEDSDVIVLSTTGSYSYVSGCSPNLWVFTAANDERRGRAWSTILTALATGMKVKLWATGDCGTYSYHRTTAVQLVR